MSLIYLAVEAATVTHQAVVHTINLPNPTPVAPPGTTPGITNVLAFAKYGGLILGLLALIVFGGRLGIQMSGRGGDTTVHIGTLGGILIGIVIISAAASIVGFVYGP